ncbi:MAG: DUF5050 domain-containing protein, partial [Bryobacteraceae bacterium]
CAPNDDTPLLGRKTGKQRLSADSFPWLWTQDGRVIVFSSGLSHSPGLWQIAFSGLGWQTSKPEQLMFAGEGVLQPAISRQGHLAYALMNLDVDIWKLDLDAGRPSQRPPIALISSTRIDHDARYSPDGKRIAFGSNRSGSFEIWVCNSDGSNAVQLTSFASQYYAADPHWSTDGSFIYFRYSPDGKRGMYLINSDGGKPKRLDLEDGEGFSRDGKWMYFHSNRSGERQIWKVPSNGGDALQVTRRGGESATESSDGRFLYYLKAASGNKSTLWRQPLRGGEEEQILDSVLNNNYAAVARGIYFIPDSKPFSIQFLSFDTGKSVTIATIPREPAYGFSVSPDGRSLIYTQYEAVHSDLMLVENFHR